MYIYIYIYVYVYIYIILRRSSTLVLLLLLLLFSYKKMEFQLSREIYRLKSFDNNKSNINNDNAINFAKAGFYMKNSCFTKQFNLTEIIECFACKLIFKENEMEYNNNNFDNIINYHEIKQPNCPFVQEINRRRVEEKERMKILHSMNSLHYERNRLDTFIEWPLLSWLSPESLAAEGFYYLKKADYCACVFCDVIIGMWETGDTAEGEHGRHSPNCSFVNKRRSVGNISLSDHLILDKLVLEGEEAPAPKSQCQWRVGDHVRNCGDYNHLYYSCESNRLRSFENNTPEEGFNNYVRGQICHVWSERVNQKPLELAEAGFYYFSLMNDSVRCFCCEKIFYNWEHEDDPWELHASYSPNCSFVRDKKGDDFILAKRRMKRTSSGRFNKISESDLDKLLNSLDVVKEARMTFVYFQLEVFRETLRQKLEQSGIPFFSFDEYVQAIEQYQQEFFTNGVQIIEQYQQEFFAEEEEGGEEVEYDYASLGSLSPPSSILYNDNNNNNDDDDDDDDDDNNNSNNNSISLLKLEKNEALCDICMDAPKEIVLLPCNHMCSCVKCSKRLSVCPICRSKILNKIKPIIT